MGRFYAVRWGPKNRAVLRSLEALHALIQDLEGCPSNSSSGGVSPWEETSWQAAALPSPEEAEAWLDLQESLQGSRSITSTASNGSEKPAAAAEAAAAAAGPAAKRQALGEARVTSSVQREAGAPESGLRKAETEDEVIGVFVDGACPANGTAEARAGLGVYFGDDDPRNVSLPLASGPQTNQRAELAAILAALISFAHADDSAAAAGKGRGGLKRPSKVEREQQLHVHCDSNYAINCVGPWADRWESNGWRTAGGSPVVNADLIKAVRLMLKRRQQDPPAGARWKGKVKFILVRGHSGIKGNEAADALAVRGAQMHSSSSSNSGSSGGGGDLSSNTQLQLQHVQRTLKTLLQASAAAAAVGCSKAATTAAAAAAAATASTTTAAAARKETAWFCTTR
ncbi:hypothetical protein Esti_006155 [Eimeria stiedai]